MTAPLMSGSSQAGVPKIADFGLARFVDAEVGTHFSGARLGTPSYMAEQSLGKATDIGPSVDIYAAPGHPVRVGRLPEMSVVAEAGRVLPARCARLRC